MSVLGVESSFNGLKWVYKNIDERLALAISQRYDLPDIVSKILSARIENLDEVGTFLYPTLKNNLPNPFSLIDMKKAAERMAKAILNNEPIGLMGDYDVDGATSTALLKMFLEELGVTVYSYIPDREDGYGPSASKMHEYHKKGCTVVATLDLLDKEALVRIITEPKNALVKQYQKLLALDDIELKFEKDAIDEIAEKAIKLKTGARGLRSIMEDIMLDIMYNAPSDETIEKYTVTKDSILNKKNAKITHKKNLKEEKVS